MYNNTRMRVFSMEESLFLCRIIKSLNGYYWCYPDNTEEEIIIYPSESEIRSNYSKNVFLGQEINETMTDPDEMTLEELALILNGGGYTTADMPGHGLRGLL